MARAKTLTGSEKQNNLTDTAASTFREAAERWQKECLSTFALSSQSSFRRSLEKHVMPELSDVRMDALSLEEIDAAVERISERSQSLGKKLQPRTLIFIRDLIKYIVKYNADPESVKKQEPAIKNEGKTFEELESWQIEKLCFYAKYNHTIEMLSILLMLFMGIRSGEICALSWDDVDFDRKEIFVHSTAHRIYLAEENALGRKTEVITEEIAWKNQVRRVELPEALISYAREFYKPGRSVMTELVNTPLDQRTLIYRYDKIFDAMELPDVNAQRIRKTWKNGKADIRIWEKVINYHADSDADPAHEGAAPVDQVSNEPAEQLLSRGQLIHRMGAEFSPLCEELGVSAEQVAGMVGVDVRRLQAVEEGEQNFTWPEVLSMLLLLGGNETGRGAVEKRGLLVPELSTDLAKKSLDTRRGILL